MFPPRVIWKSDRKAPPTKEWKTSYEREEKSTFREKFWRGKQLCDSLGKHREKCRYPAAGPEEPSAGCSYSREYESTLRGCNVLPSSLHRMFATAESAAEQQRGGEKRRKSIKSPSGKEKRDILPETRGAGDFSLDMPTQNTFDSYKMFLTGVDSIIFPPKSRDHSCLERRQVIDYSV